MKIHQIVLKNFRNYESEVINFSEGVNILVGSNAQGKTNAGEAIFFLCTGYSPRANKDKLVIRHGSDDACIEGVAHTSYGTVSVKLEFYKNDKKNVFINGMQVHRIGELLGNINSVFFNPQELKLVQESPEDRRRFLNVSISQMSKPYFYALARYNKILAQRNNLLKDPDISLIKETLPIWDRQLAKEASKIIKMRNDFISSLCPIATQKHAYLTDNSEVLSMKTESGYYGEEEDIAYALYEDLRLAFERDLRLGFTSIGPHRDDIKFMLNDVDVRVYGSQGQQRTVALSLKLAEAEIFYERFNEYPIIILDDVLSELDKKRQKKLVSAVSKMQAIFTTTHVDRTVFKDTPFNKITIENGKVKSVKKF